MHCWRAQDKEDSGVSTCSERCFFGGWGRIPHVNDVAIGTHPPSPDQSAGNGVAFVMGGWSSPLTLPNNSWPSPFWRWRRGARTCWAGAAGVWTAGGSGWVWRAAVACWCKPAQLCETRCGCSSQRWRLNTPDKPQRPTVWPWQSPVMGDAQTQFAIVSQS